MALGYDYRLSRALRPFFVLFGSVNLGGLFVIEPFITPAFFQKYTSAEDEWTLSEAMTADTSSGGGLSQLEDHYKSFIVRFHHILLVLIVFGLPFLDL